MRRDETIRFNGTSSDFGTQFFRLHKRGVSLDPLPLTTRELPQAVQHRLLAAVSAKRAFEELPGLLQRALLWDSGFAQDSRGQWVEIRTLGGIPMAQLALPIDSVKSVGCDVLTCSQPGGAAWYALQNCSARQLGSIARCATSPLTDSDGSNLLVWAAGGDPTAIPEISVHRHHWVSDGAAQTMAVIHSVPRRLIPPMGTCFLNPDVHESAYGSVAIPCLTIDSIGSDLSHRFAVPPPSALVTTWLENPSRTRFSRDNGFSLVLLAPVLVAVVALGGGLSFFFLGRRSRRPSFTPTVPAMSPTPREITSGFATPTTEFRELSKLPTKASPPFWKKLLSRSRTSKAMGVEASAAPVEDEYSRAGIPRIPFESISLTKRIGRGGFTEVFYGTHRGRDVVVKCLAHDQRWKPSQVERFQADIKSLVALHHERLVQVLGVTWDSQARLCVVSEFMAGGDLRSTLDRFYFQSRAIGFDRDKILIALHVAEALAFLHSREPPVRHRHLTSRNVLLSPAMEAKLADPGLVIDAVPSLWTAPEVMRGELCDVKADMFSFGVLLSELDTHALPYAQAMEAAPGRSLPLATVLQKVAGGRVTVRFTPPAALAVDLVELGRQCVVLAPQDRPSAAEAHSRIHVVWQSLAAEPRIATPSEYADGDASALHATPRDASRSFIY
ncbi:hypothetical protein ATCC90586_005048 [Pythium insidiosum]|nr:hypothetical protein ATCC90586_005048 [Pythium insidiosum]